MIIIFYFSDFFLKKTLPISNIGLEHTESGLMVFGEALMHDGHRWSRPFYLASYDLVVDIYLGKFELQIRRAIYIYLLYVCIWFYARYVYYAILTVY